MDIWLYSWVATVWSLQIK